MIRPRLLSPLLLSLSLSACGASPEAPANGPTPDTAPASAPAAAGALAEECLRAASAKREKRADEPSRISVKHVLVKYDGSKGGKGAASRTREAACLRAIEARDKLRGGADFSKVVIEYSEEPGAASREGSVGSVERGDLVPPFADAAFELDRGQLSDVVESDYGFHIILRTE